MKTSVIIPCYFLTQELIDMTKNCIESLEYDKPDELIIVDDGSPMYVDKFEVPEGIAYQHIKMPENKGFAWAVNEGLKAANGSILVILNNDTVCTPNWLTELIKPIEEMGYDISSIRTTDGDGWSTEDKITDNDKFGSCWAMKKATYEKLGGLDTGFGDGASAFEDTDYRRRAMEANMRIAKNHKGLIEHFGRQTEDKVDPNRWAYEKSMEIYRNKWGTVD